MSKITNDSLLRSVLYSCTHMATVGVKGLSDLAELCSTALLVSDSSSASLLDVVSVFRTCRREA